MHQILHNIHIQIHCVQKMLPHYSLNNVPTLNPCLKQITYATHPHPGLTLDIYSAGWYCKYSNTMDVRQNYWLVACQD